MNPQLYQQVKTVVAQALELSKDQRQAYVNEVCEGDEALQKEVEALLDLQVADGFLAHQTIKAHIKPTAMIDKQMGRIRIERVLAEGGMGVVYQGQDTLLKRPVAVKVMHNRLQLADNNRQAFLAEAQTLSALKHPNVCQIHDFFVAENKDVLVMELIEGQTLRTLLDQQLVHKPLAVAQQILAAMMAAHERGIIHRDLKPDNIMVTDDGVVKVLDFGLARVSETLGEVSNATVGTHQTQVSGTPGYMSPEQALGQRATTASDIWSFGLLLSELLTGNKPFPQQASSEQLLSRAKQAMVHVPQGLIKSQLVLIKSLQAKDPVQRPSARQTLASLVQIQERPKQRLRRMAWLLVVTVVALAGWKYTTDLNQERLLAIDARQDAEALIHFMLEDLHQGLQQVGRLDLLDEVAQQAQAYYQKLNVDQLRDNQGAAALAMIRIAEVIDHQGDKTTATTQLQRSIVLLKASLTSQPEADLVRYRLIEAENNLSEIYMLTGQYPDAISHADQAISHSALLVQGLAPGKGPDTTPTAHQRWNMYFKSLYFKVDIHRRMGDNQAAMALITTGEEVVAQAVATDGYYQTNYADFMHKKCLVRYAMVIDQVTLSACQAILAYDKALYLATPDDFELQKNYAADFEVVSHIQRHLGQRQEALATITEGVHLGRQLLAWDPDNANIQNELVASLLVQARLLEELGDTSQSQLLFQESFQIIEPLSRDQEEVTYLHNLLFAQIYLDDLPAARMTAEAIQARGMQTRDLLELYDQLALREQRARGAEHG